LIARLPPKARQRNFTGSASMSFRWVPGAFKRPVWLVAAVIAASCGSVQAAPATLNVTATVLSRSLCAFTTGGTPALDFGTLNPLATVPATASTTLTFFCIGFQGNTTYSVQASNGLYSPGAGLRRMRHATVATSMMGYNLSVTPASGTINWLANQTITVTGSIPVTEFQNARPGTYSDTVVLELNP
jgi:spore coat protein U-like protein